MESEFDADFGHDFTMLTTGSLCTNNCNTCSIIVRKELSDEWKERKGKNKAKFWARIDRLNKKKRPTF